MRKKAIAKFILYSFIGIFMFFITISIGDRNTIPIDHLVKSILKIPHLQNIYGLLIIGLGTLLPFTMKTWKKSKLNGIIAFLNIFGLIFTIMSMFQIGPELITQDSMGPYVLYKVVIPVVLIIPVGSVFLSFLVSYGLMELVGTLMEPVMRPIFKTPGRSAIDAVASFVGSYSLALLVTNRVYRENKYTTREAAIIATGFSTVSATFMIITLNTLDLMSYWTLYFWITLFVTFVATAITARIYPLAKMPMEYFNPDQPAENADLRGKDGTNLFKQAWENGLETAQKSDSIWDNISSNFRDGVKLALNIGSLVMSIGVIALLLAQYTGVFDILGYIFYPFTWLMRAPEPLLISKGATITIADMYVPAIISTTADFHTKFIIAVICISEILFFSGCIPCIMATDIPIKVRDIIIIWFERVVISLILIIPIVKIIF